MHHQEHTTQPPLPTDRQLIKATAAAVLIAGVVLVTAVLPAEYGIDPTGIGRILGLTDMGKAKQRAGDRRTDTVGDYGPQLAFMHRAGSIAVLTDAPVNQPPFQLTQAGRPERSDEVTLTLAPNEAAEVKAFMKTGEEIKYSWATSGGRLNFEFHGEPPNAPDNVYTSYAKGTRDKAEGTFTAKFDGTHGWFWRNRTSQPITVTVKTTGRYEKLQRVK